MATPVAIATGPRILHFMIEYFKNAKVDKFKKAYIFCIGYWSHDPILEYIRQISMSHGHKMYAGKMCPGRQTLLEVCAARV